MVHIFFLFCKAKGWVQAHNSLSLPKSTTLVWTHLHKFCSIISIPIEEINRKVPFWWTGFPITSWIPAYYCKLVMIKTAFQLRSEICCTRTLNGEKWQIQFIKEETLWNIKYKRNMMTRCTYSTFKLQSSSELTAGMFCNTNHTPPPQNQCWQR